jgi:hypothetical protein
MHINSELYRYLDGGTYVACYVDPDRVAAAFEAAIADREAAAT